MELSKRLQGVADLVSKGEVVADIGTDHGYIPIYLVQSETCHRVFAMDINEGPYLRAKSHVQAYGLSEHIITRQSDGMKALEIGEATSIIIAGMGGALVIKILEQDKRLWSGLHEMILQPQSELHKVRQYLQENDLQIIEEEMIYEDGKYYPIIKVIHGRCNPYTQAELYYGPQLIKQKHPVLKAFIQKEIEIKEGVLNTLKDKNGSHIDARNREIKEGLVRAYEVQRILEEIRK